MDARDEGRLRASSSPRWSASSSSRTATSACFDGTGEFAHPYDVLLDDYEPSLTTEELRDAVRDASRRSSSRSSAPPRRPARTAASSRATSRGRGQQALPTSCSRAVGYDPEHWRLDASVHPFARSMAHTDVRLTTRWEEDDLAMAFYSCLHEFGHGLYEAQMDPRHYRTTLAEATGLGVHESQIRLWENLVGRSQAVLRVRAAAPAPAPRRPVRGDRGRRALPRRQPGPARA